MERQAELAEARRQRDDCCAQASADSVASVVDAKWSLLVGRLSGADATGADDVTASLAAALAALPALQQRLQLVEGGPRFSLAPLLRWNACETPFLSLFLFSSVCRRCDQEGAVVAGATVGPAGARARRPGRDTGTRPRRNRPHPTPGAVFFPYRVYPGNRFPHLSNRFRLLQGSASFSSIEFLRDFT